MSHSGRKLPSFPSPQELEEWKHEMEMRGAEIDPSNFTIGKRLGGGTFGTVFEGKCFGLDVAIKIPIIQALTEKQASILRKEIGIMSTNPHPNIVLFMGASLQPEKLAIITERMDCDLRGLLRNEENSLSLFQKLKMAKDAALGMNWLHRSTPQIIHRDLKTANLLVTKVGDEYRVKVCDFGLSAIKQPTEDKLKETKAPGTPYYMAPEVMMMRDFDEKADIYSFGIVLWEIITRQKPFASHRHLMKFIKAVAVDGERPEIPDDWPASLSGLVKQCWHANPTARPSFGDIVSALEHVIIEVVIRDEGGRMFWRSTFPHTYRVEWSEFSEKFFPFMKLPVPKDPRDVQSKSGGSKVTPYKDPPCLPVPVQQYRCVKALLVDHAGHPAGSSYVDIEWFAKVLDWFGPLSQDMTFLHTLLEVLSNPWFHGLLSNEETSRIMASATVGYFMVRFSTRLPGTFTISRVAPDGSVKQLRILRHSKFGFYISSDKYFGKLVDIVNELTGPLALVTPVPGSPFTRLLGNVAPLLGEGEGYETAASMGATSHLI